MDFPEHLLNLVFLPLLGGYWFYQHFNGTRFQAHRISGQRLIFHAAVYGLLCLIGARTVTMVAESLRPKAPAPTAHISCHEHSTFALTALAPDHVCVDLPRSRTPPLLQKKISAGIDQQFPADELIEPPFGFSYPLWSDVWRLILMPAAAVVLLIGLIITWWRLVEWVKKSQEFHRAFNDLKRTRTQLDAKKLP